MIKPTTILVALLLAANVSAVNAQQLVERQVLTAPARGEGEPGRLFGLGVALDGDLAVVHEGASGGRLRAYRRTNDVWARATELDLVDPTHAPVAMSLSEGRLILTVEIGTTRLVRILRATETGWVEEYASSIDREEFGDAVAIDGFIAAIGDWRVGGGAVYALQRSQQGIWSETPLTPTPRQSGQAFGREVSVVAGTLGVAAPDEDVNGLGNAGAAYVFTLTGSTWTQASRVTAPTPAVNEAFGTAIAISGLDLAIPDRMLIGSRGSSGQGRVYAHRRGDGSWPRAFTIDAPVAQNNAGFGAEISLDGDVAIIGAPFFDEFGSTSTGTVWGADFNSTFSNVTLTRRTDPVAEPGIRLGFSVAIDRAGPTVLVGAPFSEQNGPSSGTVLMSVGSTGQPFPPLLRTFALGRSPAFSRFGSAIASAADVLLIGAPEEALSTDLGTGAVYFYQRAGADWQLVQRLQSPQGQEGDRYGEAVAVHGDIALVGSPGTDFGLGRVYVYRRSNGVWNIDRQLSSPCPTSTRREFGRHIEFDGSRAMIGAICPPEGGGIDLGIYIATRQADGNWTYARVDTAPRLSAGGWDAGLAVFGVHVAQGDEVFSGFVHSYAHDGSQWQFVGLLDNGNNTPTPQGYGYDVSVDQGLLAAASYRANTPVAVRRRSGNDFLPETTLIPSGLAANEPLWAVAVDGAAERIAVGAPQHSVSLTRQGAVFVFHRQAGNWQQSQRLLSSTPNSEAQFGEELLIADDGSLLVGAHSETRAFRFEGAVHVYGMRSDEVLRDGFE